MKKITPLLYIYAKTLDLIPVLLDEIGFFN